VDCVRAAERDSVQDDRLQGDRQALLAFVGALNSTGRDAGAAVSALLLEEFGLAWVRLTINKPGAIRHAATSA
jgi:hypothetical protein